jgi:hypothetical protein
MAAWSAFAVQGLDQLVHAQDGEGGHLGGVRVVDAAGDVAVSAGLFRGADAVERA